MPSTRPVRQFPSTTRSQKEQSYAEQMETCIAQSPFSHLDRLRNFSLYTPRQDLTTFLVRYEIFKRVLKIQGSIIECGVLHGGGLMSWAEFSAILEPTNHQRRIVGFDTFSGFPKLSANDRLSESQQARARECLARASERPSARLL